MASRSETRPGLRSRLSARILGGGPSPAERQSTDHWDDKRLIEVAGASGSALRDTRDWLHRRVERISHDERELVRRRVSVDFTIPPNLPPLHEGPGMSNIYYVPVALLRKWPPVMDFDLRDETGCPIPLLTSSKNREADSAALFDVAPKGLSDELKASLSGIATGDQLTAMKAFDELGSHLIPKYALLPRDVKREWLRTIQVAMSLTSNSLLWVRVIAHPKQRQLIKFGYVDPVGPELILWRRILSAFNYAPRRVQYLLPNLGERGSYHLEIEAPPDLEIYRAKLALTPRPPQTTPATPRAPIVERITHRLFAQASSGPPIGQRLATKLVSAIRERYRDLVGRPEPIWNEVPAGEAFYRNVRERAHMYVTGSQDQFGLAQVDFGIGNRSLLTSAWRASVVITLLLGVLWQAPGSVVYHVPAAVALLVIFPALLALLVVRPGEHPIAKELIRGVRLLLLCAAMLPVVDAVVLLTFAKPSGGDVRTWFGIVFGAGAAVTALVSLSCILPDAAST